jgi:hypothetical protein
MKTSGYKEYRLIKDDPYHEKEIKALEVFNKEYLKDTSFIVFGENPNSGIEPNDYLTERDEKVVLGFVQWLGTPIGQSFIEQII